MQLFARFSSFRRVFSLSLTLLVAGSSIAVRQASAADADPMPGAPHLLPEDTLAYIRLDNADDLRVDLANSSMGRMLSDDQLKPFASDIYATFSDLFSMISSEVGVSLEELLSIPKGQIAVALLPRPINQEAVDAEVVPDDESDEDRRKRMERNRRREYRFAGVVMVDAGENVDKLMAIIQRFEDRLVVGSHIRRNVPVDAIEIVRLIPKRADRMEIQYFEHEGTVVLGFGHRTVQDVWDRWREASDEPTMADSANFGSVISRCIGAESTRPQLTFYADPYRIAERGVRLSGSITLGLMWPMFENLGLARIRGVGGSAFRGGDVFEDITHFHVLIDPPRDGLLSVLRPSTGDTSPPKWVPSDVTGYSSIHWDFENTYTNVGKVLENFQGADALKRVVEEPMQKRLGLDLHDDIIQHLTGRMVRTSWLQPPMKLNSQTQATAFELSDAVAIKSAIAKHREYKPNALTVETLGGTVVYFMKFNPKKFPEQFRRPEPCLFVLGNWLVQTDSREFVQRIMRANSDAMPRLVEVPEYDLVASELGGKLDGEKPFMVQFMRGGDFIRMFYEMSKSKESRAFLRQAGEKNVVAKKMYELLERNELPPYEQFEKYFAPSGSFAYDEPTGMHLGSFTLRADD